MSDTITKEVYPDLYDSSLPDGEFNKANIASKRLYLAVRHLLREYFGVDENKRTEPRPEVFPFNFGPTQDSRPTRGSIESTAGEDASPEERARAAAEAARAADAEHQKRWDDAISKWSQIHTTEKIRFLAVFGQLVKAGYDDPSFGRMDRWSRYLMEEEQTLRSKEELAAEYQSLFPKGSTRSNGYKWVPGGEEFLYEEPHPDPKRAAEGDKIGFRSLIVPEFMSELTGAVQRYNAHQELYKQVFLALRREGRGKRINGHADSTTTIRAAQFAQVTERLISDGVHAEHPQIGLYVTNAISRTLGGGGQENPTTSGGHFSGFAIDLPDLDAGTHIEIIPDNLSAVRAIYYAAQLEEMKLFACTETVVEHATTGMLPISRGVGADRLYTWIKTSPRRINELERRGLYARILGLAQGGVEEPLPNREFSDLWLRFLSTVSQKFREISSTERELVSVEQVHKAGRDLAVNLSLHGYGIAHPAAIELQDLIREMIDILGQPEILRAYGVRDIWQLVDRVSSLYLGGATNGVKFRTMAASGEKIIRWLGLKAPILSSASALGLQLASYNSKGARVPTTEFRQLAELAERWLAVTGTPDATAERNTDPIDLQAQPTVPMLGQSVSLPQSVQDALQEVGGNLPALPAIPQA